MVIVLPFAYERPSRPVAAEIRKRALVSRRTGNRDPSASASEIKEKLLIPLLPLMPPLL
jgi:hypothetical protein